ncbi:5-formyltetrahydrofolate cyclo-ligase [Actinoplanes auranticolor]|uniref:5-formyltetrahydrofolate cyclo-ligase n=1 Tax=Actinoplanes auranticolor TaxID=47988 RepID=A0A919S2F0_9ACTN|nr:5-formyltetrahydrofolate cyclo-ligase [Actinoplanes auranticolor]GIM63250.1 5-formyltetrahydrofolate cyclo-ligase [Actinoplanes auranticolor]
MPDFASGAEKSQPGKIALRNQLLAARRLLTPQDRAKAAAAVQAALKDLLRAQAPTMIAGYVPLGPEPGGPDLPEVLGDRLILPVLLPDNDLDWVRYAGPDTLRPGRLGLREPSGPRLGVDAVAEATLLIVPALAVDRTGMRLGRGGGSYDRALARAGRAYTVALLHDGELLPTVPAEPHDRRVHAVITPAEGLSDTADWTK